MLTFDELMNPNTDCPLLLTLQHGMRSFQHLLQRAKFYTLKEYADLIEVHYGFEDNRTNEVVAVMRRLSPLVHKVMRDPRGFHITPMPLPETLPRIEAFPDSRGIHFSVRTPDNELHGEYAFYEGAQNLMEKLSQ